MLLGLCTWWAGLKASGFLLANGFWLFYLYCLLIWLDATPAY